MKEDIMAARKSLQTCILLTQREGMTMTAARIRDAVYELDRALDWYDKEVPADDAFECPRCESITAHAGACAHCTTCSRCKTDTTHHVTECDTCRSEDELEGGTP